MITGFYAARAGVLATQSGIDVTSNNIANVSTTGYKPLRASFSDLLYVEDHKFHPEAQTGTGSKLNKTDLMFEQGQFLMTDSMLDFALANEGFFATQNPQGGVEYTRNGAFSMSNNDGTWELVAANGNKVLDGEGNPIVLEVTDGNINQEKLIEDLAIYTFDNPYGLEAGAGSSYLETANSGAATVNEDLDAVQFSLEYSSVDLADQMVKVIEYQRAFQFNTRMIQTADEIENIVNNLR